MPEPSTPKRTTTTKNQLHQLNQTPMRATTVYKIHTHPSPLLTPKKTPQIKQHLHLIAEPHPTYFKTHSASTTSLPPVHRGKNTN